LSGAVSNWILPGAIVPGFTTVAASTASIALEGNGSPIIAGALSTSTLNNTSFGFVCENEGQVSRTFSVSNTGAGTLHLNALEIQGSSAFTISALQSSLTGISGTTFTIGLTPGATSVHT